jgi:NADH:ubiquinone oxidoreductase subunit F (NADH-binding)
MTKSFVVTIKCRNCGHEKVEYFDDYYSASKHLTNIKELMNKSCGQCVKCLSVDMPEIFCSAETKKILDTNAPQLKPIAKPLKFTEDCAFCKGHGTILVGKRMNKFNDDTKAVFSENCPVCEGRGKSDV